MQRSMRGATRLTRLVGTVCSTAEVSWLRAVGRNEAQKKQPSRYLRKVGSNFACLSRPMTHCACITSKDVMRNSGEATPKGDTQRIGYWSVDRSTDSLGAAEATPSGKGALVVHLSRRLRET